MKHMTKTERVKAAINHEPVDRIPFALWPHLTPYDQDPDLLAEMHFKFYTYLDLDFVKLMPFGLHSVEDYGPVMEKYYKPDIVPVITEPFIKEDSDWDKIIPLDASKGTLGNQAIYAKKMIEKMKEADDVAPVIQTVFSPLTTLFKLVGETCLMDAIKEKPEVVHKALATITANTIDYVKKNLEVGVDGFFFATQLANYRFMDDATYDEFGEKYDLEVMNTYIDDTWFNVIHIHSFTPEKEKSMFQRLVNYPGNCINWHDRWAGPTFAEARKITDKCLIGGINEELHHNSMTFGEVYGHIKEALDAAPATGIMVGPGCTNYEDTPLENFLAARIATSKYGQK
ncbi:MAG: uroporphyrinogen decarboxylase [Firmicutes bacterium]|nr:uroporphyrinogen decarboxylase [Bacillota bacterium]